MNDPLSRLLGAELSRVPRLRARVVSAGGVGESSASGSASAATANTRSVPTIIEEYAEREWMNGAPTGTINRRRVDGLTGNPVVQPATVSRRSPVADSHVTLGTQSLEALPQRNETSTGSQERTDIAVEPSLGASSLSLQRWASGSVTEREASKRNVLDATAPSATSEPAGTAFATYAVDSTSRLDVLPPFAVSSGISGGPSAALRPLESVSSGISGGPSAALRPLESVSIGASLAGVLSEAASLREPRAPFEFEMGGSPAPFNATAPSGALLWPNSRISSETAPYETAQAAAPSETRAVFDAAPGGSGAPYQASAPGELRAVSDAARGESRAGALGEPRALFQAATRGESGALYQASALGESRPVFDAVAGEPTSAPSRVMPAPVTGDAARVALSGAGPSVERPLLGQGTSSLSADFGAGGLASAIRALALAQGDGSQKVNNPGVREAPASASEPVVRIRIGRVEVQAVAPPAAAAAPSIAPARGLSLDALLRQREGS